MLWIYYVEGLLETIPKHLGMDFYIIIIQSPKQLYLEWED